MNAGKTSAVWLDSKRNSVFKDMQHLGMERNPPKFKVLGIWFKNDLDNCDFFFNYSEKFALFCCFVVENMDENAHYTTWQSGNCKISFSRSLYTYGFCNQTHQINTLIVYKNCAMNLYGIESRQD